MGESNVGDVNYFSTVLKMNFDTGVDRFLRHRAKPLGFFTVYHKTTRLTSTAWDGKTYRRGFPSSVLKRN
jgi:hypothetical protein